MIDLARLKHICKNEANNHGPSDYKHMLLDEVAALEAELAKREGWQLVPVEPNKKMKNAGYGALPDCGCTEGAYWRAGLVYKAMLAAAPDSAGRE